MQFFEHKRGSVAAVVAAVLALVLSPAAADQGAGTAGPKSVLLQGTDSHEDCRAMMAGEAFSYRFEASGALDFNIHYHESGVVTKPVDLLSVKEHEGRFEAQTAQTYCLMWTGTSQEDVQLRYWVQ